MEWYRWSYLQGRNKDADIENRLEDTVGGREDGMNWESNTDTYITIYDTHSWWEAAVNPALCDHLEGWELGGRGHMYACGWFMCVVV